jgi:hypothetical protein
MTAVRWGAAAASDGKASGACGSANSLLRSY